MAAKKKGKKSDKQTVKRIKEPKSAAVVGGTILGISLILFTMFAYLGLEDYTTDKESSGQDELQIASDTLERARDEGDPDTIETAEKNVTAIKERYRMDGDYTVEFGLFQISWIDYFIFALVALIGPYGWWKAGEINRLDKMEEKFPDFLRDLAQFWKGGLSMNMAVETLSEGEYGALDEEVATMARQLSWGISFNEVLEMFVDRTRTGLIERSISMVEEANKAGGKITDILMSVSNDAREIKTLQRERDDTMASYVKVVQMAWLIYLIIIFIMVNQFLPSIAAESSGESQSMGSVTINEMDTPYVSLIFFMSIIVQAVGSGMNAGVFGKGCFSVGMKIAVQLTLFAWFVFEILQIELGLQSTLGG